MKVYMLSRDYEYDCWLMPQREVPLPLEDDYSTLLGLPDRVRDRWDPPPAEWVHPDDGVGRRRRKGAVTRRVGDYPYLIDIARPVLSRRFRDIFQLHASDDHVEYLPVLLEDETFYALHVMNFVDALDISASDIKWYPQLKRDRGKPLTAEDVRRPVFRVDALVGQCIFRVPQSWPSSDFYITSSLAEAILAAPLEGVICKEVWSSE